MGSFHSILSESMNERGEKVREEEEEEEEEKEEEVIEDENIRGKEKRNW